MTHRPPFENASPADPHYKLLATGSTDIFWQLHEEAAGGAGFFSEEFKDMFEKMMTLNPKSRLKIDQIFAHPWMNEEFASYEEVKAELSRRKAFANAQKEEEDRAN